MDPGQQIHVGMDEMYELDQTYQKFYTQLAEELTVFLCQKNHKGLQNFTKSKTKFVELDKNLIKAVKGAALK